MRIKVRQRSYIKRIIYLFVIINLLFGATYPQPVQADYGLVNIPERDGNLITMEVINKPIIPTTEEEVAQVKKYEDQRKAEAKKLASKKISSQSKTTGYVSNRQGYGGQCVTWAKKVTGVYGTWGNGGRKLSLNSGPVVGAVVIFTTIHVAVITAIDGNVLTITESNYDWRGSIRTRTLLASSSTIRGYHKF